MNRTGFLVFLLLSHVVLTPTLHGADTPRLHFLLVHSADSTKLQPVAGDSPVPAGQARISCREIEFCTRNKTTHTVFVDAIVDLNNNRFEGERIEVFHHADGFRIAGFNLKPPYEQNPHLFGIDRGMEESAREHRRIVADQIRRSSAAGLRDITK